MKIFLIDCCTGCTCCWDQNHRRGPYKSAEDAARRVASFKAPDSKFWPVASQYSERGGYCVREYDAEEISGGRVIVENEVFDFDEFIEVGPSGEINVSKEAEIFDWKG